jgi:hypothetical protein
VTLLAIAALLIRLPGARLELWIDEIATLVTYVRLPLPDIASTYTPNNHVLYSLLAHISTSLFGESSLALRLPAVLFGAGLVPALYYLARGVTQRREAFASAVLVAVSYHHVYFSQSARGYTGYLFFSVISTALLLRAVATGRPRYWLLFSLLSAASGYIHLDAVFFLIAQVLTLLASRAFDARNSGGAPPFLRPLLLSLLGTATLGFLLYLPTLESALEFFQTADTNVGWPLSFELVAVLVKDVTQGPLGVAALVIGLPIAIAGALSYLRETPLIVLVVPCYVLLRLGAVLALGVGTYPRAFLIALPFGMLIAVRGLRLAGEWAVGLLFRDRQPALGVRLLFPALVIVAAIAASRGLTRLNSVPKQSFRAALAFVEEQREAEDVVAAVYAAQLGCRFHDPAVLPAANAAELEAILDRARATVWVLGTLVADMRLRAPELAAAIDVNFRQVGRFPGLLGDGDLIVWKNVRKSGDEKSEGERPYGSSPTRERMQAALRPAAACGERPVSLECVDDASRPTVARRSRPRPPKQHR